MGDPDSSAGGARVSEIGLDADVSVAVLVKLEIVEGGPDDDSPVKRREETD